MPHDDGDPEVLAVLSQANTHAYRTGAIVAVAILIVGAIVWALLSSNNADDAWETATVERGPLIQRVTAVGPLAAQTNLEVGSELSGRVAEVLVEANDIVTMGQVLARLEDDTQRHALAQARAQRDQAKAQRDQAQAAVDLASLDRDQARKLTEQRALAPSDLAQAQMRLDAEDARFASTVASIRVADAALARARDELAKAEILAPIPGVVIRRMVDPGQTVVSALQSVPLFEIASDLLTLEAVVSVDEADIGRIAPGQPATFSVTAWPDATFGAVVASVDLAPEPNKRVVSYATQLTVDNREGMLRPGLTATAEIEVGRIDEAMLVPSEALRFAPRPEMFGTPGAARSQPQGPTIWQLVDGEPTPVSVRVLGSDGVKTAIEGPVDVDRPVVLSGRGS